MVKTIGLEEHFVTADVLQSWSQLEAQWQNPAGLSAGDDIGRRLADLADERLAAMEDTGLDVQVLSLTSPGVQNVAPKDAVTLQIICNDLVADAVRASEPPAGLRDAGHHRSERGRPRIGAGRNHIGPQRRADLPPQPW